ncbi:MAB_1171c family putative transporter [Streptomyces sp. NPDC048448]|uniref:MAB_1171c family putative transporter n=1 Tax=Streptomyces sp. NPDC048448 TaxID=3365554 RepID=UPI003723CABF
MDVWIYILAAVALWAGLAAQLSGLRRAWRDPFKRALCAVIFLAGGCFALGAPPTIAWINRVTGIPNGAAPVTYGTVTAFSASSLALVIKWRGGDPERVRRVSRSWLSAYSLIIVLEVTLFVVGSAPTERRTDFDTYYAGTPFILEMILLYLIAHFAAAATTMTLCWRWTGQTTGGTRRALKLFALGWLFNVAYGAFKLTAICARWTGRDWDGLSTQLAPLLVAVGSALVAAGYVVPVLGPWSSSVFTLVRLRPLFRLLVDPADRRHTVSLSWRSLADVELQLTKRTTAIRDGLSRLTSHLDEDVRTRAYSRALADGASVAAADLIGSAAMVAVAAGACSSSFDPHAADALRVSNGTARGRFWWISLGAEQADLIRLSRAVRTPVVRAIVRAQAEPGGERNGHDGGGRALPVHPLRRLPGWFSR